MIALVIRDFNSAKWDPAIPQSPEIPHCFIIITARYVGLAGFAVFVGFKGFSVFVGFAGFVGFAKFTYKEIILRCFCRKFQVRGKFLSMAYNYLMAISPTGVEAQRAFWAAGYILYSALRLISVYVLRSHFQQLFFLLRYYFYLNLIIVKIW